MKMFVMRTKKRQADFYPQGLVKMHPEMKHLLGFCLYKLATSIRARFEKELEPYGLVAAQCAMLRMMNHVDQMSQKELGDHLAIDKATMVRMLDGLQNAGLIKRAEDPKDRRAKRLAITAKGRGLLEKVTAARIVAESEALKPLSESERKVFRELVARLTVE